MNYRTLLGCLLFSFLAQTVKACPIWLEGYVKVVDESGKVLPNAEFWYVRSEKDSFLKSKYRYFDELNSDTSSYEMISRGGYYRDRETDFFNDYYRIHCTGYTDVIISSIKFNKDLGYKIYPKLYIVMYKLRFIQKGDYFIQVPQYELGDIEVNSDSTVVNMTQYSEKILEESEQATYDRVLKSNYLSYPNPVKDKITVEVKDSMPQPFKVKIYDLVGKLVFEGDMTEPKLEFDLIDIQAGNYFIRIENTLGEIKYCRKFVKT